MKRQAHRAQRRAGETAQKIAARLRCSSIRWPLVGGVQNSSNRLATRDATAGYHRMFFERNLPLDILNAWVLCAFIARLLMGGLPN